MESKKITVLPGDGIGQEVTVQASRVLKHVAEKFDLHVELDEAATKTLHLTMLDSLSDNDISYSRKVASLFIHSIVYKNPIWDMGLQFTLAKRNSEKSHKNKKMRVNTTQHNFLFFIT